MHAYEHPPSGPAAGCCPQCFLISSFACCLLCISCLLFSTAVCPNPHLWAGMLGHVLLLSRFLANIYGSIINQHRRLYFRLPVKSLSLSSKFFLVLSELLNLSLLLRSCLLSLYRAARCQVLLFVVPCLQMAHSDHLLMTVAHSEVVTAASAWQPPPPQSAHTSGQTHILTVTGTYAVIAIDSGPFPHSRAGQKSPCPHHYAVSHTHTHI